MDTTTSILSVVAAVGVYYIVKKTFIKTKNYVPVVSLSSIPFLGKLITLGEYNKDPVAFINKTREKYGNIFTIDLLVMKMTMLTSVQYNKWFFTKTESELSFDAVIDKLFLEKQFGTDARDPIWENIYRTIMIKGLTTPEMLNFFNTVIADTIAEYFESWAQQGTLEDFTLEVSKLVLAMDVRALLGKLDKDIENEIIMGVRTTENLIFEPSLILFPMLPTKAKRTFISTRDRVFRHIDNAIKKRQEQIKSGEPEKCYATTILTMSQGNELWSDTIRNHIWGVLTAAHTNTAGIFTWSTVRLLNDKILRERVTQDILDDPRNSPVLEWCMHETMRLYAILFEPRMAMTEITVDNLVIPKGNYVTITPTLVQHDPELFPNPDQYDPYRWQDRDKVQKDAANYTLLHFGYGKHRCLGEKFATQTVKVGLFKLLKEYKFELLNSEIPTPNYTKTSGTPFPLQQIKVKVQKL